MIRRRTLLPLLAIAAVGMLAGYDRFVEQDVYVIYHGERRPAVEAGQHICHVLAMPEVRCFDSWDELSADLKANFPSHYNSFNELLSMTPGPQN